MLSNIFANITKAMEKEHGKNIDEIMLDHELELQNDPVLFVETYAKYIDWSYGDQKNYTKTLEYAFALPQIKEQLFRYDESDVYKIRQCVDAFEGVATSLEYTGKIDEAISCYIEATSITEALYTRNSEQWWFNYDRSLVNLYLAYINIEPANHEQYKKAIPLITKCISLQELHYTEPTKYYEFEEHSYLERYNDLLYVLKEIEDHESFNIYNERVKVLFVEKISTTGKSAYKDKYTHINW
ncbi:MAG: hypothetical protein HQL46_00090 [Gammaproteobacteria bacterium]|nr:hypothetical protein [Gammaproteobacteria bacterium]